MKDPLKSILAAIGLPLFTVGAIIAYRDASVDDHMGSWGVCGAIVAALGAVLFYVRRVI